MNPRRRAVWVTALSHFLFGVAPILLTSYLAISWSRTSVVGVDFNGWFWPAGRRLLEGASLYSSPWTSAFSYPAPAALMFTPFALIRRPTADALFVAMSLFAVLGTLRVLDVRDWRIYGAVLLWPSVIIGWQTANVTLIFALAIATIWRYRDRPVVSGLLVGSLLAVKPFVWPLGLWLLATGRVRGLAWAISCCAIMNLFAWSIVGFSEFPQYLHVLNTLSSHEEHYSYSLVSLFLTLGCSQAMAHGLLAIMIATTSLLCLMLARRKGDLWTITMAIVISLLASPVVWPHYIALLMVPLALARPRLRACWVIPWAMFVCPAVGPAGWQRVVVLSVGIAVAAFAVTGNTAEPEPGSPFLEDANPTDRAVRGSAVASPI